MLLLRFRYGFYVKQQQQFKNCNATIREKTIQASSDNVDFK